MLTVNDLYTVYKDNATYANKPFLSDYNAGPWWNDTYLQNYGRYDKYFKRCFSSFIFFAQPDKDIEEMSEDEKNAVLSDFRDDVTVFLIMNAEKFRQLYRVEIEVPDSENALYENVNGIETTTITYGKKTEYERMEYTDTSDVTSDAYTDTNTRNDDAYSDKSTDVKGETHSNTTHSVAPYDSNNMSPESTDDVNTDSYTDVSTMDGGARKSVNKSDFGNTHAITKDTHGKHIDSDTNSGSDITEYKRHGNIGVTTVAQMLTQHTDFWRSWEFINYIFQMIASDFLMVG